MIKYECDNCGEEVYTVEALGPGVYVESPGGTFKGKTYEYFPDEENQLVLNISLSNKQGGDHQYCYACMWNMLAQMVDEKMPMDTLMKTEGFQQALEGAVEKVLKQEYEGVTFTDEALTLDTTIDTTGMPKGDVKLRFHCFKSKEVPNVEVLEPDQDANPELPSMHAEGVLPETGPDERADDPGTHTFTGTVSVPNLDPGPTPEAPWARATRAIFPNRPGWRYNH